VGDAGEFVLGSSSFSLSEASCLSLQTEGLNTGAGLGVGGMPTGVMEGYLLLLLPSPIC
jgi:hypothetical protein